MTNSREQRIEEALINRLTLYKEKGNSWLVEYCQTNSLTVMDFIRLSLETELRLQANGGIEGLKEELRPTVTEWIDYLINTWEA